MIEREAREADAVLVLEPSLPGGAVKTAAEGNAAISSCRCAASKRTPASSPRRASAPSSSSPTQIQALDRLQAIERGTTLNVGVVSGGRRPNVVPGEASAAVDVRVATVAEARRVEAALAGLQARRPGATLAISGGFDRPPLERTEAVVSLYQTAREVAGELGVSLEEGATGGASDGNFTAALGVPTLDGLGADGAGAHAAHEHIVVASLATRAALVAGLLLRLGDRKIK